ncbi:hypothetical protein VB713_07640 [Anabaena cylindrica UHCC 0172]|nr:hypothetical protein [Anabaena cylindrica UHCC 0172]
MSDYLVSWGTEALICWEVGFGAVDIVYSNYAECSHHKVVFLKQ